jgi:hypothetical protein
MSTFDDFVQQHRQQLELLPQKLWNPLYQKLVHETFDVGSLVERVLVKNLPVPALFTLGPMAKERYVLMAARRCSVVEPLRSLAKPPVAPSVLTLLVLTCCRCLCLSSDVFLVDHALVAFASDVRTILQDNPNVLERLEGMLGANYSQKTAYERWGHDDEDAFDPVACVAEMASVSPEKAATALEEVSLAWPEYNCSFQRKPARC